VEKSNSWYVGIPHRDLDNHGDTVSDEYRNHVALDVLQNIAAVDWHLPGGFKRHVNFCDTDTRMQRDWSKREMCVGAPTKGTRLYIEQLI